MLVMMDLCSWQDMIEEQKDVQITHKPFKEFQMHWIIKGIAQSLYDQVHILLPVKSEFQKMRI